MDGHKKFTPVSQRGIGAFFTGPNAAKYSEAKLPTRGRPPKQLGTPFSANGEGAPSSAAKVGNASALLEPVTADTDCTPNTRGECDQHKRKLEVIFEDDDNSDGGDEHEGGSSDKDDTGVKASNPRKHSARRRVQAQRIRKGQSDGAWRDKQKENPHKWQPSYPIMFPWAERIPADSDKGEVHDRVRCVPCTLWSGECSMACRSATLRQHKDSDAHKQSVAVQQQLEGDRALKRGRLATVPQLLAAGNSEAEKARLQQFKHLFHLLDRGRPMLDYTASQVEFEVLQVPHLPTSHWSGTAGWELAEALDGVVMDETRELIRAARFVAISMDECVGVDKKSRLSLHVYVMDTNWSRIPLLIDLAHLRGAPDAETITQLVLDTLGVEAGLSVGDEDSLGAETGNAEVARKLVAISTDGASVMTGVHHGVSARLSKVAPFAFSIHCMAHRTNLAAAALEKAPVVKAIIGVMRDVYGFFSHSAKRLSSLEDAAEEVGTNGYHIKRIVDTRWIFLRGPAQSLLAEYKALLRLFLDEELKLYNMLRDARLYVALHALMPALVSLDIFIRLCQSRALYIGELAQALQRLKARLHEMYITPGTRYTTVEFGDYEQLLAVGGDNVWVLDPDCTEEEEAQVGLVGGSEFYPFTIDPPRGRRNPTPLPLTTQRLTDVNGSVQKEISAAVSELLGELDSRFPPNQLLEAMSIVYIEYWEGRPAAADFRQKLETIKKHYCCPRTAAGGKEVPSMLDGALLDQQASTFVSIMATLARDRRIKRAREETERQRQVLVNPSAPESKRGDRQLLDDTPTARLWEDLSRPATITGVSEFAALAQLVFVMVPGSVEDERRFSAMGYVQDPNRNRLHEHLGLSVRMFTQDLFDLRTFPFEKALKKWQEASRRGRYMMNR